MKRNNPEIGDEIAMHDGRKVKKGVICRKTFFAGTFFYWACFDDGPMFRLPSSGWNVTTPKREAVPVELPVQNQLLIPGTENLVSDKTKKKRRAIAA